MRITCWTKRDALDNLAETLLSLKQKDRDLIVLHYYSGHTLKTVAEMMGMSYINAKVIHKKALTGLRLALGAWCITCPKNVLLYISGNNQKGLSAVPVTGNTELVTLLCQSMNQFPTQGIMPFNIVEP